MRVCARMWTFVFGRSPRRAAKGTIRVAVIASPDATASVGRPIPSHREGGKAM
jgi:hypothetical protein